MTGLQHFNKEQKAIRSPMFNYHSLIPRGSFRGRQEEKWGSFRGRDHFRVDLGIISGVGDHFGVGIISGSGSFRGLGSRVKRFDRFELKIGPKNTFYLQGTEPAA